MVALCQAAKPDGEQKVSRLDAITLALLEQPAGSPDPAATAGAFAHLHQAEAEPECTPRGSRQVVYLQILAMHPLPGSGAALVVSEQESGGGESLEVLRRERPFPIRRQQVRTGVRPCFPPECFPSPIERVGSSHEISRKRR